MTTVQVVEVRVRGRRGVHDPIWIPTVRGLGRKRNDMSLEGACVGRRGPERAGRLWEYL